LKPLSFLISLSFQRPQCYTLVSRNGTHDGSADAA